MKTCAFLTLGCRVNQYETETVRERLLAAGFTEVPFEEKSDLYFVNTCAVTGESARKSRQMIRRALRRKEEDPSVIVCVAGCYTQGEWQDPDPLLKQVDLLFGNTEKSRIPDEILRLTRGEGGPASFLRDISREKTFDRVSVSASINARAFVKIQDGCNSFCSYCYVPLVRGRIRSRSETDILREAEKLCENGYREIVLTGIETGSYGQGDGETGDLASLALRLARIPEVKRIRFGSLKPSVFSEEFCRRLASEEKIMPHFHLSLQSGSSRVLAAMRRRYDRAEEENAIRRIRAGFPDAGLSADLIVGFPGETEEDFRESVSLVRDGGLLHTHIFPYSPRKGTAAASFPDQVPEDLKKDRAKRLLEEAKRSSVLFAEKRAGKGYTVLCERVRDGFALGYTENFLYTKTPVEKVPAVGEILPVRLGKEHSFSVETMTVVCEMDAEC